MNESDSERIASMLENTGYKPAPTMNELKEDKSSSRPLAKAQGADLIVVNMCSVRQSAVDRIYGLLSKFKKLKAKNPKIKTVLTGCILKKDRKNFAESFDQILKIPDLFKYQPKYQSKFSALVPISTGCNNFCAYCVVPYTRGSLVCRPYQDILKETKSLVKNGTREVWLLGQNVNDYQSKTINFPKLLEMVNNLPGDFWIRFTSPHPADFSNELIEIMANCKKITPYLNLPVQSGDDEVLKKMNRPYTVKQYKNLVKKIRQKIPDISLSTDAIVGFPGETKKQFENTVKLFKEIKYDMAYIAKYSPRPQTVAFKLKDNLSHQEKERRYEILIKILKQTALANNKKYLGKTVEVLVSQAKNGFLMGKTNTYKTIKFVGPKSLVGQFVKVKIIQTFPWNLKGKLTNKPKLVVILGPTASGKTALSIKLAKKFNGEIISADSRQVYKGMDIGTGKITKKGMKDIPHYLLDVANPKRKFTVAQYKKLADKAINKIVGENKRPFLVGGTGFYIQAIIDNIEIPKVKPDWNLRKKLEKKTTQELFKLLKKRDKKRALDIDKYNRRRLIRALEIVIKTKKPIPFLKKEPRFNLLVIGIKKSQKHLQELIQKRLNKRLKKGMVTEVKRLRKQGLSWKRLEEFGLEYRYIAYYLQNKISYQEMIAKIQKESEHYTKRQMTWFKRDKRINWVKNQQEAKKLVNNFLR